MSQSPKYVIRNIAEDSYLSVTKIGLHWHPVPRHATKWVSHYKAKQFIKSNLLDDCVPELYLPKKVDEPPVPPATTVE